MTTAPDQSPPETSKKPPFSQRHPYWNLFLVLSGNLLGFVHLVGFESIYRLDTGVMFAYAVMIGCYLLIIERFFSKKNEEKKWGWKNLGAVVFFIAFSALWFSFFAFVARFVPPVTISRETTFLTDPRTDDGWIDYAAGFEQQFLPPIPPEQNGYRILAAALGKAICTNEATAEIYWSALCAKLGLDPDLVPTIALDEFPSVNRLILQQAGSRPWTMGEFPEVALWLDKQAPLFDVLAESVRKEHFVLPLLPPVCTNPDFRFDPELFASYGYDRLRNIGTRLAYRVTLHLGNGDEAEALDDLETLYRLASVCRVRLHHSMQLYAAWILQPQANELSLQWLWTTKPNTQQIAEWEARRQAVIRSALVGDLVRLQRLCALNMIQRSGAPEFMFDKNEPGFWWKEFNFMLLRYGPWDRHFRGLNRHYDACAVAMDRPYRGTLPTMGGIFSDMKGRHDFKTCMIVAVKQMLWKGSFGFYIGLMTEMSSGGVLEGMQDMVYDVYFLLAADDLCTETAFALERYQRRHGNYPASLDVIEEADFVTEIPLDPCAREERPLQYRLEKNGGYTLYSIGRNGIDDGGKNYGRDSLDDPTVPKSADDIRIKGQ